MTGSSNYSESFEKKFRKSHDYLDQVEEDIPKKQLFGLMHKHSKEELSDSSAMQRASSSADKVRDDAERWRRVGRMGNEEYQAFEDASERFKDRQIEVEQKIRQREDTLGDQVKDFWKRELGGKLPGLPFGRDD